MPSSVKLISNLIESTFNFFGQDMSRKIIIFPCGEIGTEVVMIMKNIYALDPAFIIDNQKCRFSPLIKPSAFLSTLNPEEYVMILACSGTAHISTLRNVALQSFPAPNRILSLDNCNNTNLPYKTQIGKYSYGPICRDHAFIKSIGAFCSFAPGVAYVTNHLTEYITTHNMLHWGKNHEGYSVDYNQNCNPNKFPDIEPRADKIKKQGRATIGNDVWLGQNVIVTNSSNIGNGVIAGAGSIITKDVPDYAIVVGVPARIIRYRFNPKQIDALNRIAWWDWPDELIRERFDDFYLSANEFIAKYYVDSH